MVIGKHFIELNMLHMQVLYLLCISDKYKGIKTFYYNNNLDFVLF